MSDLTPLDDSPIQLPLPQREAPWCAIEPRTGYLLSSDFGGSSPIERIFIYDRETGSAIDQLEIRWDPYQESVEFDYYVMTPGKLEFEFGEMLYRTHYHKSGKEHFSWGVPAMRGGEVRLTTRDGFKTHMYSKRIESAATGGN